MVSICQSWSWREIDGERIQKLTAWTCPRQGTGPGSCFLAGVSVFCLHNPRTDSCKSPLSGIVTLVSLKVSEETLWTVYCISLFSNTFIWVKRRDMGLLLRPEVVLMILGDERSGKVGKGPQFILWRCFGLRWSRRAWITMLRVYIIIVSPSVLFV